MSQVHPIEEEEVVVINEPGRNSDIPTLPDEGMLTFDSEEPQRMMEVPLSEELGTPSMFREECIHLISFN